VQMIMPPPQIILACLESHGGRDDVHRTERVWPRDHAGGCAETCKDKVLASVQPSCCCTVQLILSSHRRVIAQPKAHRSHIRRWGSTDCCSMHGGGCWHPYKAALNLTRVTDACCAHPDIVPSACSAASTDPAARPRCTIDVAVCTGCALRAGGARIRQCCHLGLSQQSPGQSEPLLLASRHLPPLLARTSLVASGQP
jgi:hypothetical protein